MSFLLLSISKFCMWFYLGIKIYSNISKGNFGLYLKNKVYILENISFLHLLLILFTIFFIFSLLIKLFLFKFIYLNNLNDLIIYMSSNNSQNIPDGAKQIADTAGNSAIMATSVAGAIKIAQSIPSVSGKIAALAGGISIGAGAIAAKNIIGNVTANIGKTKDLLPSLSEFFGFTGNSLTDLLIIINYFQILQLIFIFLTLYYLIIYFIDLSILERYLSKIIPTKILSVIIYIFNQLRKIGLFTIFSLIILTLIAAYLNVGYLNFLLDNLDKIIELYSSNK